MKAVQITSPGNVRVVQIPDLTRAPEPDVLLRVDYVGM